MALLFVTWVMLKWPQFDLAYLIYQGILVNPMLIAGYLVVLTRFRAYHANILSRFNAVMNEQEKAAIHKTTRDVQTFFLYIIQMLFWQSMYLVVMEIKYLCGAEIWAQRLFDIVNTILMISYILMYVGFSHSIRKTFDAQQKQHKVKTEQQASVQTSINGNSVGQRQNTSYGSHWSEASIFLDSNTHVSNSSTNVQRFTGNEQQPRTLESYTSPSSVFKSQKRKF